MKITRDWRWLVGEESKSLGCLFTMHNCTWWISGSCVAAAAAASLTCTFHGCLLPKLSVTQSNQTLYYSKRIISPFNLFLFSTSLIWMVTFKSRLHLILICYKDNKAKSKIWDKGREWDESRRGENSTPMLYTFNH